MLIWENKDICKFYLKDLFIFKENEIMIVAL